MRPNAACRAVTGTMGGSDGAPSNAVRFGATG